MSESNRIHWFPGHMTKALREMEKEIKNVDIIFYCLDSRAPISSLNPKLSQLAKDKKIIYILTKSDLVEKADLDKFIKKLSTKDTYALPLDATKTGSTKVLSKLSKEIMADKIKSKKSLGINYSIKAMVLGVPNVGKSTLINNFCGKAKTETGNKPGVTRGKQWVVTDFDITLLDTPGTLWPSFESERTSQNLAYIGSIKEEVYDTTELAFCFIKDLRLKYKKNFEDRYGIKIVDSDEPLEVFDKICEARHYLLKNAELDYDRCGKVILNDFRHGSLGKIILD